MKPDKQSPGTFPVDTIAQLLEITARRVQQLSGEGVLPKADHGRYPLVGCVQGYIRYLKAKIAGQDESEHKARLIKARADLAEMEAAKMAGELVPVAETQKAMDDMAIYIRQRLSGMGAKLAPLVAVETDAAVTKDLIDQAVYEVLAELASTTVEIDEIEDAAAGASDGDGVRVSKGRSASKAKRK